MRKAADILSSAPAMQIRYLEAMQAMAKSANSKVIFLPAANQTMPANSAFQAAMQDPTKFDEDEVETDNPFQAYSFDNDSIDLKFRQFTNAALFSEDAVVWSPGA